MDRHLINRLPTPPSAHLPGPARQAPDDTNRGATDEPVAPRAAGPGGTGKTDEQCQAAARQR